MTGWMSSPYIKGTVVRLAPPEHTAEEGYTHRDGSSSNGHYADHPPPTEEEDDLYSVSTYAVNEDGSIMSPQEAMSRASTFRGGAGETLPTTTTPTASRARHLDIPNTLAENAMSPGGGPRSPGSPARSRPQSEAWQHHPSEALETPPSYDCPPDYEPTFHYDKAEKYRYSLAQKDRWQLHDPLREGDPNWDNLNAKDPNVLEESREVQKYRKAKAKAKDRERRERERLERRGAGPSRSVGGGSAGSSATAAGGRQDNETGFGGVNRQMSAQGRREGMLWGSSVGMGGARFE